LAFVSYDQQNIRTDEIASKCVEVLRPICQKLPVARFGDVAVLQAIAGALNEQLSSGTLGSVGEFAVIDFRSADSDWRLQTRAQIREQLRELDGQQAQFEVADADFALRQAQRLRDLRDTELENQIARDELAQHKTDVSLDLERQEITSRQKVDENRLFVEREVDMLRDGRIIGRETRRLDREDLQEATQADRADQMSQLDHEMGLENKVLAHDLSKEKLVAQAASSKEEMERAKKESEATLEDRIARLRAGRNLDIAGQEQALDLNKKRTEQEIELERVRLEHELQLQKLQMMSNIDIAQKEQFKGMTPAQMLAMQAKLLVEGGATEALSNLTASDAVAANAAAEAKVAQTKAEMLEKMLEMQSKSNESSTARQMEIMMAALNAQKEAAEKIDKANERTAASAERWNEKSIDAMAKVAATAAGKAGGKSDAVPASKEDASKVACTVCGAMNLKSAKFCGECGSKAN
jgi:ribosomal protein L40E